MQSHLMDIQLRIPSDVHSHNPFITSRVCLGAYPSWGSKFTARCHLTKYHIHFISISKHSNNFYSHSYFSNNSSHFSAGLVPKYLSDCTCRCHKSCCISYPFPHSFKRRHRSMIYFNSYSMPLSTELEAFDDAMTAVTALISTKSIGRWSPSRSARTIGIDYEMCIVVIVYVKKQEKSAWGEQCMNRDQWNGMHLEGNGNDACDMTFGST